MIAEFEVTATFTTLSHIHNDVSKHLAVCV